MASVFGKSSSAWHSAGLATGRWGLITFVMSVLAVWSVWPMSKHPFHMLPTGQTYCGTVPMLNAWTIWWNADRLADGFAGYWDAPIFHPADGALSFSEPQPATLAVAPIVWSTGSPIPAYHAYLLGSLVLNGLFAVRLLRTMGLGWFASIAGGAGILLLPLVHHQSETLQLMPLWGVLWTLDALFRLRRNPSAWRGLELGVAFSMVFMTCVHHGLFFTLLLAATVWLTIPWEKRKQWLLGMALAAPISVLLLAPLLLPMKRYVDLHAFERQAETVASLSAGGEDWLSPPALVGPYLPDSFDRGRDLCPGWLRIALATLGVFLVVTGPGNDSTGRRWTVFLAAMGLLAFVLSFGPRLHIGPWQPWTLLAEHAPGFAQVRSVYRFAYFVQLAVVLLAALGLDQMARYAHLDRHSKLAHRLICVTVLMFGAAVAFETPPKQVHLTGAPDVSYDRPWVEFLRENASADTAVVCLPFGRKPAVEYHEATTKWMLHGTRHKLPLANGYSGFFPENWFGMSRALDEDPFSEKSLAMLAGADIEFIVDGRAPSQRERSPIQARSRRFLLEHVFRDATSDVDVYRLRTRQ